MDIPPPGRSAHSVPPSFSQFIGSPDEIRPSSATPESQDDDYFTPTSPSTLHTRPDFSRSASSPLATSLPNRPGATPRINRVTSGIQRLSYYGRPMPAEREWTVFGQLLENDGLTTPITKDSHQRARSDVTTSVSSPVNMFVESRAQSPTSGATQIEIPTDETLSDEAEFTEDSDTSETATAGAARLPNSQEQKTYWRFPFEVPPLSPMSRNILKCAVAYFIGSLFTFVPQLSKLISDIAGADGVPSISGHMVATVAVYYNPAKTVGGMFEADKFCLLGLLYATFVSLGSMSMYWWLEERPGWEWLADVLVIIWIGLGMSGMAWMKIWMEKPSFNAACSMTSIILFIVIVKEGGLETLLQTAFIVFVGVIIANLTCFILWPQTATSNLQNNMTKTLDSFSTLLRTLVGSFLLEEPLHQLSQEKLQKAVENHQASFTSLRKNLDEARREMLSEKGKLGQTNLGSAYEDAVDSMTRLAQHLNGLRSGSRLQYDLAKAHRDGKLVLKKMKANVKKNDGHLRDSKGKMIDVSVEEVIRETDEATEMLKAAANMFGELIEELGPPLKKLSTTCTTSLKWLREAFVTNKNGSKEEDLQPQKFDQLLVEIERALFTFDSTSNHAVMRLYRKSDISSSSSFTSEHSFLDENAMLTSGSDHENIFLVYFFIFTLQEFASELLLLVDAMCRINACEHAAKLRGNWFKRSVLDFASWIRNKLTLRSRPAAEKRKTMALSRRLSSYLLPEDRRPQQVHFPKVRPHAPNTIQTPGRSNLSFGGRVKQSLWAFGDRLKQPDLKYAFKVGMATAILAAPAFFETTRPVFMEYRGEWALISFFVVMSPTIGATNFLSVHRVLGTFFGAATAAGIWSAFPENPFALSIFGFFFSIPCFYYIVALPQYATSSRFVLLAYNLTCLYCYNLRVEDLSVVGVALHRSAAVTVGVVWAALVSRYWWPSEARRELSRALGEFCLNMGWLYTRLVAFNSFAGDDENADEGADASPTESTSLLKRPSVKMTHDIQEFMSMELHLQIKLIELQGLLAQTQHEPRLKGPFPIKLYRNILTSLQSILDKLHSMRCVTSREEWHTSVRTDFILPVNRERREMVGNIILYFSVLSSAFRLKEPLPPYLPPALNSQQRLVDSIRRLDVVKNRDVKGSRQLLFFAYALTMKGVIQELDYLGKTLQDAFGVIGHGTEEFEALFRAVDTLV